MHTPNITTEDRIYGFIMVIGLASQSGSLWIRLRCHASNHPMLSLWSAWSSQPAAHPHFAHEGPLHATGTVCVVK